MKYKSILISFFYTILVIIFPVISGVIVSICKIDSPLSMVIQGTVIAFGTIIGIIILLLRKIQFRNDFFAFSKRELLFSLPLLIVLIPTATYGFIWKGTPYFFANLFLYLFVGICEELYFRIIILNELKENFNYKYVILIGSLLFGVGHAAVAFSGTDFLMTILTIVNAIIFGFLAYSNVMYNKNILPITVIHFLFDFESKFIRISENGLIIAEFIRGTLMILLGIFYMIEYRKNEKTNK